MNVREADAHIIEALRESGRLFRAGRVRARLPALLALRHAADLLRQDQLVRAHDGDEGRAAGGQRDDRLAPRAHQARALRQVAREQRGLGALARALLGHPAADLALRRGPRPRGLCRLARRDPRARRHASRRRAPPLRRRGRAALRGLRRRDAARARPDRRVVGLGLHAVRPVARALRERGRVRGQLPGRLHLRGARPDARVVLLAARGLGAAVRALLVRDLPLPRADPRPRRAEDVQVEGQRRRAVGGARRPRGGRLPLVLLHLEAALGRLPLLARDRRRVRAPVPQAALEHVLLLRPLRERERDRAGRAGDRADRPRPLDRVPPGRDRRARDRPHGGLRHDVRRARDRRLRRRPLELVRPAVAPALLGRRPHRLRRAAQLPRDGREAARAADAVRRRRDLREPRRQRAVRSSVRLPRAGRARRAAGVGDAGRARRGRAWPGRPRPRQAEDPPAAARGRGGGRRARARGDRAPPAAGHRGAEREGDPLRLGG